MATQPSKLNVIFMGTPEFAAVILRYLVPSPMLHIQEVVTQPDRPKGRGRKLQPPPVKTVAREAGLPVWQPNSLSAPESLEHLRSLAPDMLIVAAYGLILPRAVLAVPRYMAVNVHASLLPKYRGAAPIQRALANGESVTGITIMDMQPGLDSGPILLQQALAIGVDDTAASLHDQMADLGGRCLVQALQRFLAGDLVSVPQDEALATYAPKLSKEEGRIDWDQTASTVHNHIRAMHPWPGAFTEIGPEGSEPVRVTVYPGRIGPQVPPGAAPGSMQEDSSGQLRIACRDRFYLVQTVKPASRRPMSASAFVCGYLSTR